MGLKISIIFVFLMIIAGWFIFFEYDESFEMDIVFCPNCSSFVLDVISSSKNSLECGLYDFSYEPLADVFNQQYERGVSIDIISDYDYRHREVYDSLNPSISVSFDYPRNTRFINSMHHKFCIVDSSSVLVGTANPTYRGFHKNDNVFMYFDSVKMAELFEEEFSQLSSGVFGENKGKSLGSGDFTFNSSFVSSIEVLFCPQDDCEGVLLSRLNSSSKSILFSSFVLTHDGVEDILIEKSSSIEIKGIIENRMWNIRGSRADELSNYFPLYRDESSGTMHHKFFVIDSSTVLVGSMNPSQAGVSYNDEVLFVFSGEGIAELFEENFFSLMNKNIFK